MTMDIHYEIKFHSDWHCGSGLAAGADADALVIRNDNNLPFIPGRTIKGLVREAAEYISSLDPQYEDLDLAGLFGNFDPDSGLMIKGQAFFSNAELPKKESDAIIANRLQQFMYRRISSTAIGPAGVAEEGSLRRIEVVVPCTLGGKILGVDEKYEKLIHSALQYIKRLGQNRNRGWGRCTFSITKNGSEK